MVIDYLVMLWFSMGIVLFVFGIYQLIKSGKYDGNIDGGFANIAESYCLIYGYMRWADTSVNAAIDRLRLRSESPGPSIKTN